MINARRRGKVIVKFGGSLETGGGHILTAVGPVVRPGGRPVGCRRCSVQLKAWRSETYVRHSHE